MQKLKVDRLDSKYVYCIDKEKMYFAIELGEAPKGLKSGDRITIDDDGKITVDEKK